MENCYIPILNWQIDVSRFWGKFRISESLGRGTRKKGNWKGNEAHSLTRKSGNEPRLKKKRLPKHRKENQLNPSQKTWTAKTCEIILDHPKTAMPCHANDRLSRFQARVSLVLDSCIGCWSEKNHTKHEKQLGKQANLNLEAPKKVEGFFWICRPQPAERDILFAAWTSAERVRHFPLPPFPQCQRGGGIRTSSTADLRFIKVYTWCNKTKSQD